jgi:hypothetical protein
MVNVGFGVGVGVAVRLNIVKVGFGVGVEVRVGIKVGVMVRVGVILGVMVKIGEISEVGSMVGSTVISGVGVGFVSAGLLLNFRPKKKAKPIKARIINKIRIDKSGCCLLEGVNGPFSSVINAYYKSAFFFVKLISIFKAFLACKFLGFTL